jgi:L-alanine-DL-glutamate epimerase-like enolase superfamily enzyme
MLYFFAKEPVKLEDGMLTVSDGPGFGFELDESKIESEEELTF